MPCPDRDRDRDRCWKAELLVDDDYDDGYGGEDGRTGALGVRQQGAEKGHLPETP